MSDSIIVSKQDANQVLRLAFDDTTQALRTTQSALAEQTVVQPDGSKLHVTVDSSALPTGAATEAKQDDANATLANIETYTSNTDTSTETTANYISDVVNHASSFSVEDLTTKTTPGSTIPAQAVMIGAEDLSGNLQPLKVDGNHSLYTLVAGSVLPSGAATEAAQNDGNAILNDISVYTQGTQNNTNHTALVLDDVVSGAASFNVRVESSALPTGAATEAKQDDANTYLSTISTIINELNVDVATTAKQDTGNASLASIDSKLTSPLTVTGPLTDTQLRATPVPVSMASTPLPTGAATAANQATQITQETNTANSTASIDSKTPALGQALAAASVPVVLPAAQITTLTPPTTVTVQQPTGSNLHVQIDNFPATQPVSGTVTVTQATGTNLHTVIDSGTVAATQSGTWNINNISGTVSLPTGAATETTLAAASAKLPATLGQKTSANSLAVTLASDQSAIPTNATQAGYSRTNAPVYSVYSTTNVTTSAYVQMVASTTSATKQVQIFDSSGQSLYFAVGAAASEVDQFIIPPGGGIFNIAIPAASRISLKAVTATANSGYVTISFLG